MATTTTIARCIFCGRDSGPKHDCAIIEDASAPTVVVAPRAARVPSRPYVPGSATSKAAAAQVSGPKAETDLVRLRAYFAARGAHGATDAEAQRDTGMDANTERPRRINLAERHQVEKALTADGQPVTRPTLSGRQAQVWVIVPSPKPAP